METLIRVLCLRRACQGDVGGWATEEQVRQVVILLVFTILVETLPRPDDDDCPF